MAFINITMTNDAPLTKQFTDIARSNAKLGKGIGSTTRYNICRTKKSIMPTIKMHLDHDNNFEKFDTKVVLESIFCEQATALDFNFKNCKFQEEMNVALGEFSLYYAESLTKLYKDEEGKGPEIYIQREDMNHFGAIGEVMMAKNMGRKTVLAAISDGQLGITIANACTKYGLHCTIFMAYYDFERQSSCVKSINSLGAQVRPVAGKYLNDALLEARREWTIVTTEEELRNLEKSSYLMGTVVGPHPDMVIGEDTKNQYMKKWGGKLPDVVLGYIGSASSIFHDLIHEQNVRLIGVETESEGLKYQRDWQKLNFLKETGKVEYHKVVDTEAVEAYDRVVNKLEGIVPSEDDSYAFAYLHKLCPTLPDGCKVVVVINC